MKTILFLFSTLLVLISCNTPIAGTSGTNSSSNEKPGKTFCLDGAIYWDADPAADGLGWHFSTTGVGEKAYVFDNLPAEYQVKELPVTVCMYKTDQRAPVFSLDTVYKHHITSIKKR
jgi:hypothetical protein